MASFDFYAALLLLGVFQGILLSMVIIFEKSNKHNQFLIVILLVLSFSCLVSFLWRSGLISSVPHIMGISTPTLYLLGPSYWFYINTVFGKKISKNVILLHLAPFIICIMFITPFYMDSTGFKLAYINEKIYSEKLQLPVQRVLNYGLLAVHLLIYLMASFQLPRNFPKPGNRQFRFWKNWVMTFNLGLCVLVGAYIIVFSIYIFTPVNTVIFRDSLFIIITLFIHFVAYICISRSKLLDKTTVKSTSTDTSDIESKLNKLLSEEKIYLEQHAKVKQIARKLKIPPHKLSEIVNMKFGVNFNEYLNRYRVEEVKKLLSNTAYDIYDLDGIAKFTGFSSRSSLTRVFKRITQITPKQFKKQNQHRVN